MRKGLICSPALAVAALLCASAVQARPVTYPGGWMSMTEVDGSAVTTQVDHTLNRRLAMGAYALTEESGDRLSSGGLLNVLLMRKNTADGQANVYLTAGGGPSWVRREHHRERNTVASGFFGGEADWETRRWFIGAATKLSVVGDDTELGWRTRVGVAPYVAGRRNAEATSRSPRSS